MQTARVGQPSVRFSRARSRFRWWSATPLDDSTSSTRSRTTQIQTPDRRADSAVRGRDDSAKIAGRTSSCGRTCSAGSSCRATSPGGICAASSTTSRRGSTQNVKLPQGYHVEYGGQFESEAQASWQLLWLSLGVIVAIFFILSTAFGSSRDGLLIMLNLPLALIGGVIGVYLAGGVLSVASIVGFITLFGIATRNGIMLVSHIRHLQEHEGVTEFRTAVVRGATERLVPILMTALAAGLALVPIALSAGEPGSEIQAPMAMVIMFGLLSSTALNMIVVPDSVRAVRSTGGAIAYRVGVTGGIRRRPLTFWGRFVRD